MTDDRPLAMLRPSPFRRVVAAGILLALAGLFAWVALAQPLDGAAWRVGFLALAGGALWMAARGWRGTDAVLILDREGLRQEDGTVVAPMTAILSVDRGAFAFKPSGGFLLRLTDPMPRHWTPGLWWRLGRRVGVGGVTGAGEGKAMADILSAHLVQRARGLD